MSSASPGVRASVSVDPWAWVPPGVPPGTVNILNPALFTWQITSQSGTNQAFVVPVPGNLGGGLIVTNPPSGGVGSCAFTTLPNNALMQQLFVAGATWRMLYEISGTATSGIVGWANGQLSTLTNTSIAASMPSNAALPNNSSGQYSKVNGAVSTESRLYHFFQPYGNVANNTTSWRIVYMGVTPP